MYTSSGSDAAKVDRVYSLRLKTTATLKDDLENMHKALSAEEKVRLPLNISLTFDHVMNTFSAIDRLFNVSDLYISATEKGVFDTTKSVYNLLLIVYTCPYITNKVTAQIEKMPMKKLASELALAAAKKTVAKIGLITRVITVGFASYECWQKTQQGSSEEFYASAASLVAAGMILASGVVYTPVSAVIIVIGAVIGLAQFIYSTFFVPDAVEYQLRTCVSGKEYKTATGSAINSAYDWQCCPGTVILNANRKSAGICCGAGQVWNMTVPMLSGKAKCTFIFTPINSLPSAILGSCTWGS